MSIICSVIVEDGIIMAADRLSKCNKKEVQNDTECIVPFVATENSEKLYFFKEMNIGISACGKRYINNKSLYQYLNDFFNLLNDKNIPIRTMAEELCKFTLEKHGNNVSFQICGYHNGVREAYAIYDQYVINLLDTKSDFSKIGHDTCLRGKGDIYGSFWDGYTVILNRIIPTLEPQIAYFQMSLKDGIELAETLIDTTIRINKFRPMCDNVGGNIDVLVLTNDGSYWKSNSTYNGLTLM